jgi:hypothetical protein
MVSGSVPYTRKRGWVLRPEPGSPECSPKDALGRSADRGSEKALLDEEENDEKRLTVQFRWWLMYEQEVKVDTIGSAAP